MFDDVGFACTHLEILRKIFLATPLVVVIASASANVRIQCAICRPYKLRTKIAVVLRFPFTVNVVSGKSGP